ncbi:P-loop NTPase family protein [Pseudoalteromonas xiamenensis]
MCKLCTVQDLTPQFYVFAFPVFIVGCCLIYIVLFFAGAFDVDKDDSASTGHMEAGQESAAITAPNDTVQIVNGVDISLDVPDTLPYNSHQMFISGVMTAKIETTYQYDVVFEVKMEDGIAYIDSTDLKEMGYNVNYFSQCKAVIKLRNTEYVSYCKPRQPPKVEREPPNMQFNPTFTPQFEGDAPSEA